MSRDVEALAHRNRLRVMSAIRTRGPVARVAIAQETGLARATVSALTGRLMADGLVREVPADVSDGPRERGRPRVLLDVAPEAHRAFGVRLGASGIVAASCDFSGTILDRETRSWYGGPRSAADIADAARDALAALARRTDTSLAAGAGIGVGLPGFVDAQTGLCAWSPALAERGAPVRDVLERAIGHPVLLDNDANLAALAARQWGLARGARDFAFVALGHGLDQGVGMALVVDGRVQRPHGRAGAELGHTKITRGGALCRCGRRGCVEAYVADYALVREARSVGVLDEEHSDPAAGIAALAARARAGEPAATEIVRRAGAALGVGLANLVNLLAPPLVLVAGALDAPAFEAAMRESFEAEVVSASRGATRLLAAPLDADGYLRGAAALVFDALYPGST